eukprot:CAMPEP_0174929106 /NCGR_PEP_ID=MMETSP1355-20121228/27029_1 /TAXON_ID=464990 /ORGANISM="Hemiselmis tepida, Strain CCMP443" /LENGTH=113 /DNA_ID=CAMNT_0016175295 /DNA_START=86 /DNA_END=427 /DNA_ORIENTATION=-
MPPPAREPAGGQPLTNPSRVENAGREDKRRGAGRGHHPALDNSAGNGGMTLLTGLGTLKRGGVRPPTKGVGGRSVSGNKGQQVGGHNLSPPRPPWRERPRGWAARAFGAATGG